jgi:hypothetical protein
MSWLPGMRQSHLQ